MKKCGICHAENPDSAKFCRDCGNAFYIDMVNWISIHQFRYKYSVWKQLLLIMGFLSLLPIFVFSLGGGIEIVFIKKMSIQNMGIDMLGCFLSCIVAFIVGVILFFVLIYQCRLTTRCRKAVLACAHLIEDNPHENEVFIRSGNSVGVFDKKKIKVVIPVEYSSIERIPPFYKLQKDGKYGLYNRMMSCGILNCDYDLVRVVSNIEIIAVDGSKRYRFSPDGKKY